MNPSAVSLSIPCRAECVSLCRLVAGSLGLRDGLDEDVIADLKVIVTEACNCFLAMAAVPPEAAAAQEGVPASEVPSLQMDFDSQADAFVINVTYPEKRELVSWLEGREALSAAGLGLTILKALTDEMVESVDGSGTVLRLTKRLPA